MENLDLTTLSNHELLHNVRRLAAAERKVTLQLLHHINELERRRCYNEIGFATAFDFLTKGLGYSEPAAWRRIQAARILRAVPDAGAKIESGELNITTLSKAQTAIRNEEKRTGEKISSEMRAEVLTKIETGFAEKHRTTNDVDRNLRAMFPESLSATDLVRVIDDEHVRAHVTFTHAQIEKINRLKEVLAHRNFGASLAEIIEAAVDELLERRDPLKRIVTQRNSAGGGALRKTSRDNSTLRTDNDKSGVESPSNSENLNANRAPIKPSVRNFVLRRDGGQCQFPRFENGRDETTSTDEAKRQTSCGLICGSRFQVEVDHIVARANGGTNEPENLRVLCRTHNFHAAELAFGKEQMEIFRKND